MGACKSGPPFEASQTDDDVYARKNRFLKLVKLHQIWTFITHFPIDLAQKLNFTSFQIPRTRVNTVQIWFVELTRFRKRKIWVCGFVRKSTGFASKG